MTRSLTPVSFKDKSSYGVRLGLPWRKVGGLDWVSCIVNSWMNTNPKNEISDVKTLLLPPQKRAGKYFYRSSVEDIFVAGLSVFRTTAISLSQ
jgi:hypothetical protein